MFQDRECLVTGVASEKSDHEGHSACGCAAKANDRTEKSVRCGGQGDHAGNAHHHHDASIPNVLDPVCGMSVDPATSKRRFEHQGEPFHFCSAGCRTKFAADPAKYLDKRKPEPALPAGTIYTCPMHPQIRQLRPGSW